MEGKLLPIKAFSLDIYRAFLRAFFPLLIEIFGASDDGGSLLHNKPFDYVMARPELTGFRARYSLLSGDFPALAKGGSWLWIV